jgi:S1-C subfamily serine protease
LRAKAPKFQKEQQTNDMFRNLFAKRNFNLSTAACSFAVMAAAAAVSSSAPLHSFAQSANEVQPPQAKFFDTTKLPRRRAQNNFIAEAVAIAQPSLVHISNSHPTLFGIEIGSGASGFLLDKEGFVATNAHAVMHGADNLKVWLSNGKQCKAQVHAVDKSSDLALIKLEGDDFEDLVPATIGKSSDLKAGEWVVALGSPLNLQNSVTVGVVSSISRKTKELGMPHGNPVGYIQTDCAINFGNSGGPLVNLDGEVVGINSMKAQFGEGIAFCIPMDFAHLVLQELKMNKRYARPFLGIQMVPFQKYQHWSKQHTSEDEVGEKGVFVAHVHPKSPAERAGFKQGDVIMKMNQQEIHDASDMYAVMVTGRQLLVEVQREGKSVELKVTPEAS